MASASKPSSADAGSFEAAPRPGVFWTRLEWLALAACVALGVLNLWAPFTWDQAIFAMGAEKILHGGLLYRDYWDTKQPGVFWFFALAERLFGLSEEGVHALELMWFTAFAAVLITALRRAFDHRWSAGVAALTIVGFYWAVTEDWHQTQPEGLVAFPMFVSAWCALEGARGARWAPLNWFLAGLAGGAVGVFKLLLVALPALCWLMSLGLRARDPRPRRARDLLIAVVALGVGLALPLVIMSAVLMAQGVWAEAWAAWVDFPKKVGAMIHGFPVRALKESFVWFFHSWTSLLPLAVIGAWSGLRGRHAALTAQLLAWIAASFPVILVQRFSGWEYHAWLLLVPLGLLAARGVDVLATPLASLRPPNAPRERRVLLVVALAFLFAQPLAMVVQKTAALAKDRFVSTPALRHRHLLRASRGGAYYRFGSEGAFLQDPAARPGPIFVVGNPLVYWLSGRRQSVPRTGGILTEYYTADDWADTALRLETTATPYVFVEPAEAETLQVTRPRSDAFLALLDTRYRVMRQDRYGTWYERIEPGPAEGNK
jgi:hypothetical protein